MGVKVAQEWQPQLWQTIHWGPGIGPHSGVCGAAGW